MPPLILQNVEAELSYAYLHAVASRAGMECRTGSRHEDNAGVDAELTAWGPFTNGGYLTEINLKIQLKATIQTPPDDGLHYSYFLRGVKRYDDLRQATVSVPRLLVVLFLPSNADKWLSHSEDELILRRCAYWVSLRGAPPTDNDTGVTVKIPKAQTLTPDDLAALAARLSRRDIPVCEAP